MCPRKSWISSNSRDSDLHPGLAVAWETADEEILSLHQLDPVFPGLICLGAARRTAVVVACLVHGHHVVVAGPVVESCTMQ